MIESPRIAAQVEGAGSLELDATQARILAVGSQLVHGSVGLNAAERVYTAEGMPAIRIPSIVLSVMPHYPSVHHIDIAAGWIGATLNDLDAVGATESVELVSAGYLVSVAQAEALAEWLAEWLSGWPAGSRTSGSAVPETGSVALETESARGGARRTFVLDPTLGDIEVGFYTDPALAQGFRDHLIPLATGITPNLFELAHLTGTDLADLVTLDAIEQAARTLMGPRTEWVIVTGLGLDELGARGSAAAPADGAGASDPGSIGEMVVTGEGMRIRRHEKIDTAAKGLGDTFTAMLNVALLRGGSLDSAIDLAAAEVRRRAE